MAMQHGGEEHRHIAPALFKRAVLPFTPAGSTAVQKATRGFDETVHECAALGAHRGYELPKKALKKGVTTVEVALSDRQVYLFFPDQSYRTLQRGRATMYDLCWKMFAVHIAAVCAILYFNIYFVEYKTAWDIFMEEYMPMLAQWMWCLGSCAVAATVLLFAIAASFVWALCCVLFPTSTSTFSYGSSVAIEVVDFTARHCSWLPGVVHKFVSRWIWVTRESMCAMVHNSWICPAPLPSRFQRVCMWLVRMFWVVQPLLAYAVFWQSVGVFFVVWYIADLLLGRRTVWRVRLTIESEVLSIARCQKTRATQETTSVKVAATPILTHVENHVRVAYTNMPHTLRDKYLAICQLVAAGWADNRVRVVQILPGESDDDESPVEPPHKDLPPDLGVAKRLLKTRTNTAPENLWRKSVRVMRKTWSQLFDDVQRGEDRTLPGQDNIRERYCGVVTGPEFFDITEGFAGNVDDEIGGVSRHLRQLKSPTTGEYMSSQVSPEAEARLNRATDIICEIVGALASAHFLSLAAWSLPQKWGNAREKYWQKAVEIGRTVVSPVLTGFVKTMELALPINKLPRLVGSMGMVCCAKDATALCSVEHLFKKFFPHLVVKGMTNDGVVARFSAFAARAHRLGLKILSIDMSAMDSSWTMHDRDRVRRVMQTIVDRLQDLLETELQKDLVQQSFHKKRRLRWMLRYIIIEMDAVDSILFSGERGTSIGNRILMLIVWSAELLRVFGDDEGVERIRKMFHCPPEAHNTGTDEKPHGVYENHYDFGAHFPEDPMYDNNIGDGDDCTLAIPHDMYKDEKDFIAAYEAYYKLVEPCSAWDEGIDMECLSTMVITKGKEACSPKFAVPKVARNAQRLIAHKLQITPADHYAAGNTTHVPTPAEYATIATDLWQRSFALKNSMVTRHLCRAMFEYCYEKAPGYGTIYEEDLHRLGKVDGDLRLSDCLEQVRENVARDVSGYVMVKATNFSTFSKLSIRDVKALSREWFDSDVSWSTLELTDDLCAKPDVLLTNFPIGPDVAVGLGFKQELVDLLKQRQLVKGEGDSPEMSVGTRPGGSEASTPDGESKGTVYAASVIVYKGIEVLCGYEPKGKPRQGMLSLPGGKLDKTVKGIETFREAAVRELQEEAQLTVRANDLDMVRTHQCGKIICQQFIVAFDKCRTSPSACADKLDDFRFRSAEDIVQNHAPAMIAKNLSEIISDGKFIVNAINGVNPDVPSDSRASGHAGSHNANGSPGSSVGVSAPSAVEVKPASAEEDGTGPSQRTTDKAPFTCPFCKGKLQGSPGQCPNAKCKNYSSKVSEAVGARTSRDQGELRQTSGSSPVNGDGSPGLVPPAGTDERNGNTGGGLSLPKPVNQNAAKSRAAPAESKGKSPARHRGKFPRDVPAEPPQTAAQRLTAASKSSSDPGLVDQVSRESEGGRSAARSAPPRRDAARGGRQSKRESAAANSTSAVKPDAQRDAPRR